MKDSTKSDLDAHANQGRGAGHFVTAVLENNLSRAVSYGDERNLLDLVEITKYVFNHLPADCWGSRERVDKWRAHRGLEGLEKESKDEVETQKQS